MLDREKDCIQIHPKNEIATEVYVYNINHKNGHFDIIKNNDYHAFLLELLLDDFKVENNSNRQQGIIIALHFYHFDWEKWKPFPNKDILRQEKYIYDVEPDSVNDNKIKNNPNITRNHVDHYHKINEDNKLFLKN